MADGTHKRAISVLLRPSKNSGRLCLPLDSDDSSVLEDGANTRVLSPQELQVKSLSDRAKQLDQQAKQPTTRQAVEKAEEKLGIRIVDLFEKIYISECMRRLRFQCRLFLPKS